MNKVQAVFRRAILLLLFWLSLFVSFPFLAPIHVTVVHPSAATPTLKVNGAVRQTLQYKHSSTFVVEIVNTSAGDEIVELALPILASGTRMRVDQLDFVSHGWNVTYNGERLESRTPGSRLRFTLSGTAPELPFLRQGQGGRALVSTDEGFQQEIDLNHSDYSFYPLSLPPQKVRAVTYAGRLAEVATISTENPAGQGDAMMLVNVGGGRLLHARVVPQGSVDKFSLDRLSKVKLAFDSVNSFLVPFLSAAALLWSCVAVGRLLIRRDNCGENKSRYIFLWLIAGLCLTSLVGNSLLYFIPANPISNWATIFMVGCTVVYAFQLISDRNERYAWRAVYHQGTVAGVVSVILAFWPVAFASVGYLGFIKTDSFFYTNLVTVLQHSSLFERISGGSQIGFGVRSIDLTLATIVSSMTGMEPALSWITLAMAFMFIPPLCAYEIVSRSYSSKAAASTTAWGVAVSAPIIALYLESYFAQFLLTGMLYMGILSGCYVYQDLLSGRLRASTSLPFASACAATLLLYPYFSAALFIVCVFVVIAAAKSKLLNKIAVWAMGSVLLANIGLFFLMNPGAPKAHLPFLNALAEHTVFSFYRDGKFPAFIFGLVPFHGDSELFLSLSQEFGSRVIRGISHYMNWVAGEAAWWLAGIIGVAYMLSLSVDWRRQLSGFRAVLPAMLVAYVVLMVLAYKYSGLYAYAKLAWTVGTLLPLVLIPTIVTVLFGFENVPKTRLRLSLGALIIALYLIANLLARSAATFLWSANPYASVAPYTYTAVAGTMQHVKNAALAGGAGSGDYAFYSRELVGPENQSLMILSAHLYSSLAAAGYTCVNCKFDPRSLDFRSFYPLSEEQLAAIGTVVNIDIANGLSGLP